MKTALFLTLLLASGPVFASNKPLAPEAFLGDWFLVSDTYGMCDPEMQGLESQSLDKNDNSYVEIDLGTFAFTAVNQGPQTFKDDQDTSVTNAYTTSDSLIMDSTDTGLDSDTDHVVAQLSNNGQTLSIVDKSSFDLGGGDKGSTDTECVYKLNPNPSPDSTK